MERIETVEFTNMCMICDGSRVIVMEREKRDWPGVTFPGGHVEPGESFTADLPKLKLSLDMRDMLRVFTEEALSEFFYYQEGSAWKYDLK